MAGISAVSRALVVCALLAGAGAAAAGPVELLFQTAHLASVAPGATLRYAHTRASDSKLAIGPDLSEVIAVEVGEGRATRFVLDADGAPRPYQVDKGVPGNPMLAVMLENVLRATAKATGGSPFYLRNRIRDAMGARLAEAEAGVFTVRPFASDAQAARMGPFAEMELRFEVRAEAPGMLVSLSAVAGEAYSEEIRLDQGS